MTLKNYLFLLAWCNHPAIPPLKVVGVIDAQGHRKQVLGYLDFLRRSFIGLTDHWLEQAPVLPLLKPFVVLDRTIEISSLPLDELLQKTSTLPAT